MFSELVYLLRFLYILDFCIVWMAIPAFVFYPIVRRIRRNEWQSLFSWIDIFSYFATHSIWFYGFTHDFNYRGAGRLLDIVFIGLLYGILILLRMPFVWRYPEKKFRIAAISSMILISASIVLTWFVDLANM